MGLGMALAARYPVSLAVLILAFVATGTVFLFARPHYSPKTGETIRLPVKQPAADVSGAAGWVWPEGVPGWKAGQMIKSFNVSGVQPVEIQAAQLAAARRGLAADQVRVVSSTRPSTAGVLAILAAPMQDQTPATTCLAAVLQVGPVAWECPGATPSSRDLSHSHVLVAAAAYKGPELSRGRDVLYFVGVARGDVHRVVMTPGIGSRMTEIYKRGETWGQFEAAVTVPRGRAFLAVYGRRGLVERMPLDLKPGQQRVLR